MPTLKMTSLSPRILLLSALLASLQAAPLRAEEKSPVAELIAQLRSDDFVQREEATEKLHAAGREIVGPLGEAMRDGDRELVTRGAHILRRLAMPYHPDRETSNAAYSALRDLRKTGPRTAAVWAKRHLDLIHTTRQQIAVSDLIALGAELNEEYTGFIAPGGPTTTKVVVLGEEWRGNDDDLRKLAWLYNIRYVTFKSDKITGAWLEYAAEMESLEFLSVRGGGLDDQQLQRFVQKQPQLRILELKYIPISDAGLTLLKQNLPNLVTLKLYGTDVTPEGAERLKQQLPRLELDYRRGGFLGVGCQTHQLGCQITQVRPASAASKAGFIPGDIIIAYDGKAAPDFDKLTKLISANDVGDKVRVELMRHVQTSLVIVPCAEGGLKTKTKPHRLGHEIVEIAKDSPLRQPVRLERDPFSIGDLRAGDVLFRINGMPLPADKSVDEIYNSACKTARTAARQRAVAEVDRNPDAPKDEAAREKLIQQIIEQEIREERMLIQFSRGGKLITADVKLGMWD